MVFVSTVFGFFRSFLSIKVIPPEYLSSFLSIIDILILPMIIGFLISIILTLPMIIGFLIFDLTSVGLLSELQFFVLLLVQ